MGLKASNGRRLNVLMKAGGKAKFMARRSGALQSPGNGGRPALSGKERMKEGERGKRGLESWTRGLESRCHAEGGNGFRGS